MAFELKQSPRDPKIAEGNEKSLNEGMELIVEGPLVG
jgi:hypothetical protein